MTAILAVRDLRAGYGGPEILHGVSVEVRPGELVGIIGANGAGKSTLVRAVAGLTPRTSGGISLRSDEIGSLGPVRRIRVGIGVVPDGPGVWPTLTVAENLRVGALRLSARSRDERMAELLDLFPRLRERLPQRAGDLSGGERKMLAIARALIRDPRVLILDEPSVGLSPLLVSQTLDALRRYVDAIPADRGILLVEQNVAALARVADRIYGLYLGSVVDEIAAPSRLLESGGLAEAFRLSYAGTATRTPTDP